MTTPSTVISRIFGGRAVGWAGGQPDAYLTTPPYSMLEFRVLQGFGYPTFHHFTRKTARTTSMIVQCPSACPLCARTGAAGPTGPAGPPGPTGLPFCGFAVGDWVWSANYKYRSVVRGTVAATSGDFVYLKLEWPLPYVGKEHGECPRVWSDRLVKPNLLERIVFAAGDDGERYRFRRGFRIRLTKREFLNAIS